MTSVLPQRRALWILGLGFASLLCIGRSTGGQEAAGLTRPIDTFTVVLIWELADGVTPPFVGRLAAWQPVRGEHESRTLIPLETSEPVRLDLPKGTTWTIRLESKNWWTPVRTINVPEEGDERGLTVQVWPLANISLRALERVGSERIPLKAMRIRLERAERDHRADLLPQVTLRCLALTSENSENETPPGSFRCPVPIGPRGKTRLVLHPPGFLADRFRTLELKPGQNFDLATVELVRGNTLSGSLSRADGEAIDRDELSLVLEPQLSLPLGPVSRAEVLAKQPQARVTLDGYFVFEGVEPGAYRLRVRHPGMAPLFSEQIQVVPVSNTQLRDPLVLQPPLDLGLTIDPARDLFGGAWRVELKYFDRSADEDDARTSVATSDEAGRVVFADRPARDYSIRVYDSTGQAPLVKNITVTGPETAEHELRIDYVEINGEVTLGDDPLQAELWFGARNGMPSLSFATDEDGRFSGFLPRAGLWTVEVGAETPEIEFRRRLNIEPRHGVARVKVEIPGGRVFGSVVDSAGQPIGGVAIRAVSLSNEGWDELKTISGRDGAFEVLGLSSGPATIEAEITLPGKRFQANAQLDLAAGASFGPLDLVMIESVEIVGRVVGPAGAIPGAEVSLAALQPRGLAGIHARSGAEGSFSADVSPSLQLLGGTIAIPGVLLAPVSLEVEPPVPVVISVDPATVGGTLELHLPRNSDSTAKENQRTAVVSGNVVIDFATLTKWVFSSVGRSAAAMNLISEMEEAIIAPKLAPGNYALCRYDVVSILNSPGGGVADWIRTQGRCVSGDLAPGGHLVLDLAAVNQFD